MSEIRTDGTIAFELLLPNSIINYKAFRFPWKTNLFVTNPDSIFFEFVPVGDSAVIAFNLISNSSEDINITGFYNREESYTVEHTLPFILSPYSSESINVKFKPISNGWFKDTLHIRSDTDTSRIAQLIILAGRTDTTALSITEEYAFNEFVLEQNYPNPFNPTTTISYGIKERSFVELKIYDILGREVFILVNKIQNAGSYEVEFSAIGGSASGGNAHALPSGIYFYRIQVYTPGREGSFVETKKMILLK
jgi:hypothetical protein